MTVCTMSSAWKLHTVMTPAEGVAYEGPEARPVCSSSRSGVPRHELPVPGVKVAPTWVAALAPEAAISAVAPIAATQIVLASVLIPLSLSRACPAGQAEPIRVKMRLSRIAMGSGNSGLFLSETQSAVFAAVSAGSKARSSVTLRGQHSGTRLGSCLLKSTWKATVAVAMTLQEAIDYASAPPSSETEYGTITALTISMHEDLGGVMYGGAWYQTYNPRHPGATFHPDLPLLDWGPSRLDLGLAHAANRWFNRSVPGFSTRGQGGLMLNVAGGGGSMPIDLSVRRDPGLPFLGTLPIGPGVQIEIETLSAPGGSATS